MKKLLLSAAMLAGLAALTAAPAMAQATGHIGARFGNVDVDLGPVGGDDDLLGVDGAVNFPTGGGLNIQADVGYFTLDDADVDSVTGSVHLGMRNDQYAFGGYVGLTDNGDDNGVFYGGEFVYYMPQLSLSAGIGAGSFDDTDTDFLGALGEGRYFVSDNLRFDGRLGFVSVDAGAGGDDDGLTYGIGGEWKPDGLPVSFFAAADFSNFDDSDVDITVLQLGVRFDFGNGTLKARDRNGPAFKALSGFSEAGLVG
jgi:hypothetical protein